jgi:hypothetical protein
VVVEGVKEVKYAFQAAQNVRKRSQNGWFNVIIDLKIAKNAALYLKVLTKIYTQDVF